MIEHVAPTGGLDPAAARAALRARVAATDHRLAPVDIERRRIPAGPSGAVPVHVVRPHGADATLPGVVYCHGGGWVLGGFDTHERLVRELAVRSGAVVVFPEYHLAPEARYPVQNEQCYAVLEWVAAHGAHIGVDPGRLAVAGDGAGGTMATVLALMAGHRGGPRLAAQVLICPIVEAALRSSGGEHAADEDRLARAAMRWCWDHYLPDASRRAEATASPLRARPHELAGLPPALVVTAEGSAVRDAAEAYADRLADAGVPVVTVRYRGAVHDFVLLDAPAGSGAARAAVSQCACFLRDALV
jgi:acetyl esterase